jgi:hypothetical protein
MKYKKYIVFAWDDYEAQGGLDDIKDSFDTQQEAESFIAEDNAIYNDDHYRIIDRDTWEVIFYVNRGRT